MPENENPTTEPEDDKGTGGGNDDGPGGDVNELPAWARKALTKANGEAAKYRTEIAKAKPILDKAKADEEARKTNEQKLTEASAAEKARADKAELALLRLQVGLDKGLTAAQAKRLQGSNQEELEADADDLLEAFGGKNTKPEGKSPTGRPKERLRGGTDPEDEPEELDPRKLAAKVSRL